jgi:chaperonin GroES
MKINPRGNRIVFRPDPTLEKRVGNLIIPESVTSLTEKDIRGTIIAVGPGVRNPKTGITIPPDVEPGDRVIVHKYAGSRMFVDRQEIMLIDVFEILVLLPPETDQNKDKGETRRQ